MSGGPGIFGYFLEIFELLRLLVIIIIMEPVTRNCRALDFICFVSPWSLRPSATGVYASMMAKRSPGQGHKWQACFAGLVPIYRLRKVSLG